MTRKQQYVYVCDAPGCTERKVAEDEPALMAEGPGGQGWSSYQVNDDDIHGCCEHHLAAAILASMGFENSAKSLLSAISPQSVKEG